MRPLGLLCHLLLSSEYNQTPLINLGIPTPGKSRSNLHYRPSIAQSVNQSQPRSLPVKSISLLLNQDIFLVLHFIFRRVYFIKVLYLYRSAIYLFNTKQRSATESNCVLIVHCSSSIRIFFPGCQRNTFLPLTCTFE